MPKEEEGKTKGERPNAVVSELVERILTAKSAREADRILEETLAKQSKLAKEDQSTFSQLVHFIERERMRPHVSGSHSLSAEVLKRGQDGPMKSECH